ncbi:MAG TPA: SsrA-binding protein [Flavobacterium sp.]
MFRLLAKINRLLLPSFTKRQMDMGRAKKWQLAVIGWRYYVTVRALDEESKLKSLR